jgi:hypothetical protein
MKIIKHHEFFLNSLRTAVIFIAGLLTYEILKMIEYEWNKTHPGHELFHFAKRKTFHFIVIFLVDLILLYLLALLFDVHL